MEGNKTKVRSPACALCSAGMTLDAVWLHMARLFGNSVCVGGGGGVHKNY